MDVFDFFNSDKPLVRKTISGGATNGRIKFENPSTSSDRRNDYSDTSEYAKEHVAENDQQMLNVRNFYY